MQTHREFKPHTTKGTHERSALKVKLRKDAATAEVMRRRGVLDDDMDDSSAADTVSDADLLLLIKRMFDTTDHAALLEVWDQLSKIVQRELYVDARRFRAVTFPRLVQLNVFPAMIERYFHVSFALSLVPTLARLCRETVDGTPVVEHLCAIPQFLARLGELVRFAVMHQHSQLLTQLLWLSAHLSADHESTPSAYTVAVIEALPVVEMLQMFARTQLRIHAPLHCTKPYIEVAEWKISTWLFCLWAPRLAEARVLYLPAVVEYFVRTVRELIHSSLVYNNEQELMVDAVFGFVRILREDVLVDHILPVAHDLFQLLPMDIPKLTYPLILFFSTLLRAESCPQTTATVLDLRAPLTIDGVTETATFLQVWCEIGLKSSASKILREGVCTVANIVLNDEASAMRVFCDTDLMAELQLMLSICPFEIIQEVVLFYCDLSTVISRAVLVQESNLPYDLFRALASCGFRKVDLHVKIALFRTLLVYFTEFTSLVHVFLENDHFEQCIDDCALSPDPTLAALAAQLNQWIEFATSDT